MISWEGANVFVTGSSGFLGSWLVKELVDRKVNNVVVLIRDVLPSSLFYQWDLGSKVILVRGEIGDTKLVERILNEFSVDTVFHLAAQSIVTVANNNPISTFESNIGGTWSVLEACRKNKIKRVIVASSDKSYGDHKVLPYKEDAPLMGKHPYDVSKSCADLISQMYFHHYGLPVCVTRCSNLYGGGHFNYSRVIPGTIRRVLNGEQPIVKGLLFSRDFLYIEDAVDAYLMLAEGIDRGVVGEVFNFGNGKALKIYELVLNIISLMESNIEPIVLTDTEGEIFNQYLSIDKANSILGWVPKHSMDAGLKKTINWYKKDFEEKG